MPEHGNYPKQHQNMTKEEFYNDKGEKVELHKSDGADFYTNPKYWDCECEEDYIHLKAKKQYCSNCNSLHFEQPDSRQNEIDDYESNH